MADPINVAVVGAGRGRSQIRSLQALPELFQLVAWVDLNVPLLHERIDEAGLSRDLASGSLQETLDQRAKSTPSSSPPGPAPTNFWLDRPSMPANTSSSRSPTPSPCPPPAPCRTRPTPPG